MDGERFDTIAKGLATGSSRRRLIGGLIGGAAAALAGTTTLAAKRKKGKGRKAKVRAQSGGEGKGQEKVTLCHWDEDTQRYERITVGAPGADAHLRQHTDEDHPDFKFTDEFKCCNASTCEAAAGPCRELRACDEEGHCEYTNIKQGEPCPIGDDDGVCIGGECRLLSTGTTCTNADPCAQGIPCGAAGVDCVCYSTTEGGNVCLERSEATCDPDRRPTGCNTSAECDEDEFCAPLAPFNPAPNPTYPTNCCDRDLGLKRGFCVPVSAVCTAVA